MDHKAGLLERASGLATRWTGTSAAFALAVLTIVLWAATGPVFHYSDTWQLVINTGTTIITFYPGGPGEPKCITGSRLEGS